MDMKEGPLKHVGTDKVQYEKRKIDPRMRARGGARLGPQAV